MVTGPYYVTVKSH